MTSENKRQLHLLVKNATHESVTADKLSETRRGAGRPRLNNRPPISYIRTDEQPHYIFETNNSPSCYGKSVELERSRRYRVVHLITNERWVTIAGNRNGDNHESIPLENIKKIDYESGRGRLPDRFSSNLVLFETESAYYQLPISRSIDSSSLESLVSYIEYKSDAERGGLTLDPSDAGYATDEGDSYEPDEETIAQLLDEIPPVPEAEKEADSVVREAETGVELVTELNEIIESYSEPENTDSIDNRVAQADSAEELRKDVRSQREKHLNALNETFHDTKKLIEEADPEEVGQWSVNATRAAAPAVRRVPGPMPHKLALTFLTTVAIGTYASGKKDTMLDSIDPKELRQHSLAMAGVGAELEEVDGEAVGALLGSSSYIFQMMAPEEYAQWVTKADPKAVLEGAEMGAQKSQETDIVTKNQGSAAGAAFGLMYGYTTGGDDHTEFREILDADIYKDYLEEMSESTAGIRE